MGPFIRMIAVSSVLFRVCVAAEFEVDQYLQGDPVLPERPTKTFFPVNYISLWRTGLQHPERDLQRQLGDSITRAHGRGMEGLDQLIPDLVAVLETEGQTRVVKRAISRALITLDARSRADLLWKHSREEGLFLSQLVEPALAAWDYQPIRKEWRSRLSKPSVGRGLRILALQGLANVGDTQAAPAVLDIVLNQSETSDLRLAAARTVAQLDRKGLLDPAKQLVGRRERIAFLPSLLAMELLQLHSGEAVESFLNESAETIPSVAATAGLRRLLELNPGTVAGHQEFLLTHPDVELRRIGCQALAVVPTAERCGRLCEMLGDRITSLRRSVRRDLMKLAENEAFRPTILDTATRLLNGDDWRTLEQCCLLLGGLDYEPVAERLTELLHNPRPEVYVSAAWGLRVQQVPEMLPAMLDRAVINQGLHPAQGYLGVDEQQNQLFQAFGIMKFLPANELMRTYIPKGEIGPRDAAIWALGKIYAGKNPEPLVELLRQRLADEDPMNPELDVVKRMSAVAIGRMQGKQALETVVSYYESETPESRLGQACGWARQQMTGEPYDAPSLMLIGESGFVLEPLRKPEKPTTSGGQ